MKKILSCLLIIMMFTLCACGNNANDNNEINISNGGNNDVDILSVAGTKTLAFFQKFISGGAYTMEMKTEFEGMTGTVLNMYDGEDIYTESEYGGVKSCMIMKDGYQYVIDHVSKTCIKMQMLNATTGEIFSDEAENYEVAVNTGKTDYNGKTYDYEEFMVEGESVQYLFEGDDLKVIKATVDGTASFIEVVSFKKGVDKSLFEVPVGYSVMEM